MLWLTDEIEKAEHATLLKASSQPHQHINKLITNTWKILHYYSKKWPSKHKTTRECSQTLHRQTRSLHLYAACRHDWFQGEIQKWKWSRELSISSSHCGVSSFVNVEMRFLRFLSYFLTVEKSNQDTLRHHILSLHYCSMWKSCDCFSDFFLPLFCVVVIYSQKQIALYQCLNMLSEIQITRGELCQYQPNMAWCFKSTRQKS